MESIQNIETVSRFKSVDEQKATGATYTPKELADFVANQIVKRFKNKKLDRKIRLLDPAIGEGELILSLLRVLPSDLEVEVYGFDTNESALEYCETILIAQFPQVNFFLEKKDFLEFFMENSKHPTLFDSPKSEKFDLIIANPPYVRTQILGSKYSKELSKVFNLNGRVDLYQVFILGIAKLLDSKGTFGIIVSNRFMTTKTGSDIRGAMKSTVNLQHVWDLGDTKIFNAAVLPAVIVAEGKEVTSLDDIAFTSIYETKDVAKVSVSSWVEALDHDNTVELPDGKRFCVQQGTLQETTDNSAIWKIANEKTDSWLNIVQQNTWKTFAEIGKVRVGVKTCADKVFITKKEDWETVKEADRPELLRRLTTHHIANRYRLVPNEKERYIIYPHMHIEGKNRAVNIKNYPISLKYLEAHRSILEGRTYLMEGGRNWYELWVPQKPDAWEKTKLVFRDISERPCFWIDKDSTVVNGDCYWMICENPEDEELLWLALAVSNSTFIESFYDRSFNNKLYSGRRRFITQYVEKFPLPDPGTELSKSIVELVKNLYGTIGSVDSQNIEIELDKMVWEAFGLDFEEVSR
jgi:adenine-specific DNA-methyltransferase